MIILTKIDIPEERKKFVPIGLLYVGNSLKKAGHDVKIFHCTNEDIKRNAEIILKDNPLFVGFSVMSFIPTTMASELSKEIKEQSPETIIVWGGIHPSLCPEQCIGEDYIDIVVIGEGEKTAVKLADALKDKKPLEEIPGIAFNKEGKVVKTKPAELILDMDKECGKDWDLINLKDYFRPLPSYKLHRTIATNTSRGCPYNCGFCYNQVFNNSRFRCHSAEFTINEINYLKDSYGIDGVFLYDDNLFANKKRALDIIQNIKIPYLADIRVDAINDKIALCLGKTDCFETEIGIESGSERILKLINKGFTVNQIWHGLEILDKYKVPIGLSFMVGFPTETWKEAQQTIKLIADIHKRFPQSSDTIGVYIPYPGTTLYSLAIENGFEPPKRTEDWGLLDRQHGKLDINLVKWGSRDLFQYIRKHGKFASFLGKFHPGLVNFPINNLHKLIDIPEDKIDKVANLNSYSYKIMNWLYQQIQFKNRDKIFKSKIMRNLYYTWWRMFYK